jgi:sec-independent protein translocase protein TatB
MNLFGMGPMEILVITVVALIIFGPGRLPEIGAQAGKAVRDFRKMTNDLTSEFQDSIGDVQATVGEMKDTARDIQRETAAIARSVPNTLEASTRPASRSSATAKVSATDSTSESIEPGAAEPADPLTNEPPAEPAVAEVSATRSDPFADLAALDDDDVAVKPANSHR